jgi:predicted DNA-binding transcriptional regulator AlpA
VATVRDPAPGPAGLPLRQDQGARQAAPPPTRPFLLPCFPAAPGGRAPWPAGRGPDLTGRAERSVRRRGPTDGPPPGTPTAPGRPVATPDGAPGTADDPLLTIDEVIAELRVSRAAFYRWRRQGAGPPAVRLPGGGVRVRRSALTVWLRRLEEQDTQER